MTGQRARTSFRHEQIDMDVGECVDGVSSPEAAARLIYTLVRMLKPARVVEIGSAFGVGTMYIAEALRMNGAGRVTGIEHESWRADIANRCLSKHWASISFVDKGAVEEVYPHVVAQYGPFDFAFVDAVHKFDNTVGYHDLLRSSVKHSMVAVFDDMNWSSDMERFWDFVSHHEDVSDAVLVNGRWGLVRYHGKTQADAAAV